MADPILVSTGKACAGICIAADSVVVLVNMIRDDLSHLLIHLTKGVSPDQSLALEESMAHFESIVSEQQLRGGTGYIRGGFKCVCFTEAPISKLSHILATTSVGGFKYAPYGVMVDKTWLYEKGGRPVIYGPGSEYDELPDLLKYRHVRFELSPKYKVDYSWEREWRIQTESLPISPSDVTLVVPNRRAKDLSVARFGGGWHYIVLSDLGVLADL